MKSTVYYSKRRFTTETLPEVTKSRLVYDFAALIAAMRAWAL